LNSLKDRLVSDQTNNGEKSKGAHVNARAPYA
jgi:hypothetical protein